MRAVTLLAGTGALALVVGLVGGPSATPAEAADVVPTPSVTLPDELDRASFYEPQTVCDPTARPGSTALGELLERTYGAATIYIPRACTSSTSEHFDGRAVDWMRSVRIPAQKAMVTSFLDWLLASDDEGNVQAMARRMGIMYIIWNNRMIRTYDPGRGWTEYRNCLDSANSGQSLDTSCHRNHVHFSLSWDGAAMFTSWWSGEAVTLPYCSARSTSASPGTGTATVLGDTSTVDGLVPVTPTLILNTSTGNGAGLSAGCRLLAGRSLYPKATVSDLVPSSADWVAVKVTSTSNAPAKLTAWSSGAARPAGQVSTPIGTTTSTILVPVASDGTIALSTSLGAAGLNVKVVGYVQGDPVVTTPDGGQSVIATRPGKPRAVAATSARRTVTTTWKKPSSNGGAKITGYRVEALKSNKKGAAVAGVCTKGTKGRSCAVPGLKKGRTYWMSVSVTNAVGTSWADRVKVKAR